MKIRTDFVTNSSSSSYVLVVDKAYMDKVIKKLSKYHQRVFEALKERNENPGKCFGKDVYIINWMCGNNDTLEYLDIEDDRTDDEFDNDEGFENALMEVLKDDDKFFMNVNDC